jgi:hypothetical protein
LEVLGVKGEAMCNFNDPKDVPGRCNAHLYLADDYGDNTATIRCIREAGHDGIHWEHFERDGHPVHIEWEQDERTRSKADA